MQQIILASGSPRRRELLERCGVSFSVITADTDEATACKDPEEIVKELSQRKAKAVLDHLLEKGNSQEPTLVIGADTIVAKDGQVLGKPADEADALRMLKSLSGDTHQVYTGVTLYYRNDPEGEYLPHTFAERTLVHCYPIDEEVLKRYIATGEPMDKAGAYGIQGIFGLFIRGIEGDIQNVIGLPVPRLLQEASKAGIHLCDWQGDPL